MHLRHIISLGLCLMSLAGSGGAWAEDCPGYPWEVVTLTTQAEVDAFPQDCDSVLSSISISGSDITNIDSLSNITSVGSSLEISNNTALPNIDGLVNLTSVDVQFCDKITGEEHSSTLLMRTSPQMKLLRKFR